MLSSEDYIRYQKQLKMADWGEEQQLSLAQAKVLVVGAGGLASGALPYLAAAGIGNITIIDGDTVDLSNLGRQVIYQQADLGEFKAKKAEAYLQALNPSIQVQGIAQKLTEENAENLIQSVDLVIDCTDNFKARYLINDHCVASGKPFIYAAIHTWEGHLSVCNMRMASGKMSPTYRCFFPNEPGPNEIPTCDEAGVLGFLPGILGIMQAKEVIFCLAGMPSPAQGALMTWDAQEMRSHFFALERDPLAEEKIFPQTEDTRKVRELSPEEAFAQWQAGQIDYLLDVREEDEWDFARIEGAIHIPMSEIPSKLAMLPKGSTGLVLCHHGMRSAQVIVYLQQQAGFKHVYNLAGGIDAWSRRIDPDIPRY